VRGLPPHGKTPVCRYQLPPCRATPRTNSLGQFRETGAVRAPLTNARFRLRLPPLSTIEASFYKTFSSTCDPRWIRPGSPFFFFSNGSSQLPSFFIGPRHQDGLQVRPQQPFSPPELSSLPPSESPTGDSPVFFSQLFFLG